MARFPDGFLWGAGTSAYQVEGSPLADGAGPSIQHRFAHTPGNVRDGATGDVAADHYRRYRDDVALMQELGLQAYQFSIGWARVVPEGTGAVNPAGLDFYDALVDALLEVGIRPVPILHVWDVPAALQDRGGWANRDSPGWFAEYASIVFERLGDRAGHWLTICEPATLATVGYLLGLMAPATRDLHASLRVGHHLLLGHGLAVQAYRASGASGAIGTSTGLAPCLPASERDDDRAAADRANLFHNATYLDPVLLGRYPDEVVSAHGAAWPEVRDGDLAVISSPVDFVGITYYGGQYVAAATDADGSDAGDAGEVPPHLVQMKAVAEYGERLTGARPLPPGGPSTDSSFPIAPDFLRAGLRWLKARYGNPPVIVTENGAAFDDVVDDAGRVDDERREDYLRQHLLAAHAAIEEDGVDLRGWMVWSFLDTWEFFAGHGWPFGLVHVDRGTLARTVKRSGRWYAGVMAQNAV